MTYKTAVIGGGLAGLTSSILLAKSGIEVELFEKSMDLGGRAKTQNEDGIMFNLGAHALYNDGEAKKILTEIGVKITGNSPNIGGYGFKNAEISFLPSDFFTLFKSKLLYSYSSKFELSKFLLTLSSINFKDIKNMSIEDWINKNLKHDDVKDLFKALVRLWTFSNDYQQNAEIVLKQGISSLKYSVTYIDNGWQNIINQLEEIALNLGVKINKGSKIKKIIDNEKYSNILLKNESSLNFDSIVLSLSPSEASKILENETLKKYESDIKPIKVSCFDLALKKLPNPDISFVLGIDKDIYYSIHSKYAKLSKNNEVIVHIIKYLSDENDSKDSLNDFENLMNIIQPNWDKYIIKQRFLPSMIVSNGIYPSKGKRPEIKLDNTSNIYICGDWVGDEGLLADASLSSALSVANMIKEKNLVYK